MQTYSLSTWVGDQMVAVERIKGGDDRDAIAYATGRLDERTAQHTHALAQLGVRYRLDHRLEENVALAASVHTLVGTWFLTRDNEDLVLAWHPN